ncbi:hypothetical protein SAMN02745947_02521 [Rhodococcus rhodochrous J3]|uniref:Uncharacterized protein n=1 Tax=Rhodococcus rhodochrous J3 TaxID=903528 RepID=A0ABY1MAU1_RHORH|nr:hypothetical protein SAMN02745947_02521 [Rhodococcus rhodochrous J3]
MYDDVNRMPFFDQKGDCVGKLKLSVGTRLDATQCIEDLAVQEVSARGGQR